MKIGVDGGGLPSTNKSFGNAIFSENLVKAIAEYDKQNSYFVYTLKNKQHFIKSKNIYFQTLKPSRGWMKFRVPLEELISPKNLFLALNQSIPLHASGKVISFSHGLSFYYYKSLYKSNYNKLHRQLENYLQKSRFVVTSSRKVTNELKKLKPLANIITIPFGIPYDFQTTKEQKRGRFFLFVGMNHPIKQVDVIIQTFLEFIKEKEFSDFKLYLCGSFKIEHPSIVVFPDISRASLKTLYQKATGYLSASLYESFNLPVLEALSQQCPVIALHTAIIPEMKNYVFLVEQNQDFLPIMKEVAKGNYKKIDKRTLHSVFSWKKYIEKLVELYNNK